MKSKWILGGALAAIASAAIAAVTFDPATGTGFVGKGDVQLVYGWNNKALNDNAANVRFQATTTKVTEVTWTCTKDGVNEQERSRTTNTTTQGVVSSIARDNKTGQITGFMLNGWNGTVTTTSSTDGPALNSCPDGRSGYYLSVPAGEPVVVTDETGLQVSKDGTNWFAL